MLRKLLTWFSAALMISANALSFSVNAAEVTPSKRQQIEEMLQLMQLERTYAIGMKNCVELSLSGGISPAAIAAKDGSYFGFTPASKEWSSIVSAFGQYVEKACNATSIAQLKEIYVNHYANSVSEADLIAMNGFMKTKAGRAFLRSQEDFVKIAGTMIQRRSQEVSTQAYATFQQELRAIQSRSTSAKEARLWWKIW